MGFVFKKPLSPLQKLELEVNKIRVKVKELWETHMLVTGYDVTSILEGTYISRGTNGEGELNGVPTDADVNAILDGTYSHKDYALDEFAPDSFIDEDDLEKIIAGNYQDTGSVDSADFISDADIESILKGLY